MSEKLQNPFIELRRVEKRDCLKFTFKEKLTEHNAELAIEQWKQLFSSKPGRKITLVWHCLEMTGYEPMARAKWQRAMKELRNQIDCIWVISDSKIVQAGAKIVSVFTSFNINSASSEDKIFLN